MKKIIIILCLIFASTIFAEEQTTIQQKIKVNMNCIKQLTFPEKDGAPCIIFCINNYKWMMVQSGFLKEMRIMVDGKEVLEPCDCGEKI